MVKKETNVCGIDKMTNLYNEEFLRFYYNSYITEHPFSKFIMIDIRRFKEINDTYGHAFGDNVIKFFAKALNAGFSMFPNSVVAHLHGDEFAVLVSDMNDEMIQLAFNAINKCLTYNNECKLTLRFNAGSAFCGFRYDDTFSIADAMMYSAKKNGKTFQPFDEKVWRENLDSELLMRKIDSLLLSGDIRYAARGLYDLNGIDSNVKEIYSRDSNGKSIFDSSNCFLLDDDYRIKKLDLLNLSSFSNELSSIDGKHIILVGSSTIMNPEDVQRLFEGKDVDDKIILSFDPKKIKRDDKDRFIAACQSMSGLPIELMLDKYDFSVGDDWFQKVPFKYVKFDSKVQDAIINSTFMSDVVSRKTADFEYLYGISSVFDSIKDKESCARISEISSSNTLLGGDFFDKEKMLCFKK